LLQLSEVLTRLGILTRRTKPLTFLPESFMCKSKTLLVFYDMMLHFELFIHQYKISTISYDIKQYHIF